LSQLAALRGMHPDTIRRMIDNVSFIAEHYRAAQAEDKVRLPLTSPTHTHPVQVSEDWSYVAMVIDRLFLILFTIVNVVGTVVIILQAPSLYDQRPPIQIPLAVKPLGGDTGIEGMLYNASKAIINHG
jgi:nicotinic acetylcholine receptor